MRHLLQDCRYALRMARKHAGLTAVIVFSLAIGIGANTAIFSVVDALLLRPLPYPHPERLAAIWLHSPGLGIFRDWPSPGQYIDIRNENHSFEEMALARLSSFTITGLERPEKVDGMAASSTLFPMLGAQPLFGRLLLPEEDKPGKPRVAIISYRLWKRLFRGDANLSGKTIVLDGTQHVVAGVLPADFRLNSEVMPGEQPLDRMDVFLPLPLGPDAAQRRGDENFNIVVRLKPGVSIEQAQADINVIAGRIRVKDKRDRTFGMTVIGLQEQMVGDVRRALLVLLGSVALVLLIACANVANLLLTRAAGRQKEIAIRTALGAGVRRIVQQLLAESVLLAMLGGAAGLVIAQWTLFLVRTLNPGNIPRLEDIRIDGSVLLFTFGVSLVTGILFGCAPAWRAMTLDLNTSLRSGSRGGRSESGLRLARNRLRGLLVASELALALLLLTGAGLLIRSYARLQEIAPGFATEHVVSMQVAASGPKYAKNEAVAGLFQEIETRIRHLPGVEREGLVSALPLTGMVGWGGINVEGYTPPPGQELQVDHRIASTDYFRTMEIPLRKGRFFTEHDNASSQEVAIVDEKFAQRFWPRDNPIGKKLWFDPKRPIVIVGVVGVVKQYGLDNEGKIAAYFPHRQQPSTLMYVVARTAVDQPGLARAMTREISAVEPGLVVYDVRTMRDRLHDSLARQRFSTTMLGGFAGFALVLAAVGVYGVMSYLVSQSTHDIGVYAALGAQPRDILGLVVRQGMELAVMGIAVGLVGAFLLSRVMASLLFGVAATDILTFGAVVAILAGVALLATLVPARRASRVDPMVALREE